MISFLEWHFHLTMATTSKQVNFDLRYVESLLIDESNIQSSVYAAGRELLQNYSKIPENEIASHVVDVVCLQSTPMFAIVMLGGE